MDKKNASDERKAFKDYFDADAAKELATRIKSAHPDFDTETFVDHATQNLSTLEFHGRVYQFSDALAKTLPKAIPEALHILTESLPPVLPDCEAVTNGWLLWPVGQFIADHGTDHFEASFEAMSELTQRFTSEFAIRPFLEKTPGKIFKKLEKLTAHQSPHIRRWCSEGIRTRLPWGRKLHALIEDPSPIFPILEALKDDEELYVRRSVANNLNDIAKDHPEKVIAICKQWNKNAPQNRKWLIKHALRTLIKDGNPQALQLIGFAPPKDLHATLTTTPERIKIGESIDLNAQLKSSANRVQNLMLDYVVHYVRKNGSTREKVFKWTTAKLEGKSEMETRKKHSMRITSVRALYPGIHKVEIQANGIRIAQAQFELIQP